MEQTVAIAPSPMIVTFSGIRTSSLGLESFPTDKLAQRTRRTVNNSAFFSVNSVLSVAFVLHLAGNPNSHGAENIARFVVDPNW
jgi:hypothetical protein